jgi:hypothetical protein
VLLLGWGIWKDVRRAQRRKEAVRTAASSLPRSEQIDWFNRAGRYKEPGAIPRNLALDQMTTDELARLIERTGEFSDLLDNGRPDATA